MTIGIAPATGLQNGTLTASGGTDNVVAPCMAEVIRISSNAHNFTIQRVDSNGNALGAAASAEEWSSTYFVFRIYSGRAFPFTQGQVVALLVGTGSDTISIVPENVK